MPEARPLPPADAAATVQSWDIFCRVIDNHGDLGVCWRLAADLGARGHGVRLWVDDASALRWMAPLGAPGVTVRAWQAPEVDDVPGDVVIEAFGCDPPAAFVERMAAKAHAPVWINLEYLSAESYVERAHRLPSPQWSGPGRGLTKWFFYPGFTDATGGLLREPGLTAQRQASQVVPRTADDAITVSLFCYAPAALPSLLDALANLPSADEGAWPCRAELKVTPGWAAREVSKWLGSTSLNETIESARTTAARGTLAIEFLPYLSQPEFDRLLWNCDLNLVRGEDSLVRAIWASRPMIWQAYPQDDGSHLLKLEAFLARYFDGADDQSQTSIAPVWRAWNGADAPPSAAQWHAALRSVRGPWQRRATEVAQRWSRLPDLTGTLIDFARERGITGSAAPTG